MMEVRRAAVVGAGIMGHSIAQLFAQAGIPVCLTDSEPARLAEAQRRIAGNLSLFVEHGLLARNQAIESLQRVATANLHDAVSKADFVTECVTENLGLKQTLFEELDRIAPAHAIFASNTSSLPLAKIGQKVKNKSRLIVTHYFNPPHIVPIVEVAPFESTSPEVTQVTLDLMVRLGQQPVHLKKSLPGFLVNRVQSALVREVLSLLEQDVASIEDIDKAVRGVIGFRLAAVGPLEVMDFGGLDTWLTVARNLFPEISSQTDAPTLLLTKVAKGELGMKSGQGFYKWHAEDDSSCTTEKVRERDERLLNLLKLLYRQQC